jgi:anion-transporting  ArsA/GET3 family ATPase
VRCHVVTGKGGTGKTTVAAALALSLAADGRHVLLVETEGRQGIAQLFDTPPLPYEERRVAVARGGGEVKALAIDVEAAFLEYLDMFYNLKRAGRALRKMGAVDFATAIAPGLRDVLLTGKIKEAVTRRHDGRFVYDAVVVDAPPTGRITRFLNVTGEVAGLARSGPIKAQSDGVMAVFRSGTTAVHLVTLLEDMPVQETADGIEELRKAKLPVGGVVVNLAHRPELDADERDQAMAGALDEDALRSDLERVDVRVTQTLLDGLLEEAREHSERRALEDEQRARIAFLDVPTFELSRLPEGIDVGGLYELAAELRRQEMV